MSAGLATRCPACATAFRVVPDQLRVSEGWVRCGRCAEVFNAASALIDLQATGARPQPITEPAPAPAPVPSMAGGVAAAGAEAVEAAEAAVESGAADAAEAPAATAPPHASASAPAPVPAPAPAPASDFIEAPQPEGAAPLQLDAADFAASTAAAPEAAAAPAWPLAADDTEHALAGADMAPARVDPHDDGGVILTIDSLRQSSSATDVEAGRSAPSSARESGSESASEPQAPPEPDAMPAPLFIRQAERAARWRRPGVRSGVIAAGAVAALALTAQLAFAYRDTLAARYPVARPLLAQACDWLNCSLGALRSIDALAVESSGLLRVEKSPVYKLSVELRNRSGLEVALPAVDLVLTDTRGKLLARRVLAAADLGVRQTALAAGSSLTLQATLQLATEPVAGYTIELFYP